MSKELFDVAQKLTTDHAYRAEFMANPRQHLADLGLSTQTIERLIPQIMAALVAGKILLDGPVPENIVVGWI